MNPAVHIHLDETGQFGGEDERCAIGGFHTRQAPTDADMESLWRAVLGEMPDQFHATERPADELAPVIDRLLDEMEKRGFMPIIFEHLTRAFIVDNATTYAYVMADGLVRLGRLMSHDPTPPRELRVLAASRVAPDAYGVKTPMTRDDYVPRIEEARPEKSTERVPAL